MPRFSKQVLSQHLRTLCERQLALSLYTNEERKKMTGWPEEDKTRGQVLQLAEEGNRWQQTVIKRLRDTFGASNIIGTPDPSKPTGYATTDLRSLLQAATPNTFIVEGKYEIDDPASTFRQAVGAADPSGAATIKDFNGKGLAFSAVVPDIIQVFDPADGLFDAEVRPDGSVLPLKKGDPRLQLRVIDVKLTSDPGAPYFAEVAYYAMSLAGWLVDEGLDADYVVVPEAAVWPGSHQASQLRVQVNAWKQDGYTPTIQELIAAMKPDLEALDLEIFAPRIRRLISQTVPRLLLEPNWRKHDWHVASYCSGCDFLGYPWGQHLTPPKPTRKDLCWHEAENIGDLSRVPFLSRGTARVLRDNNIPDVPTLAQKGSSDPDYRHAIHQHQELRAQQTVIPSRAQALQGGTAFVAPGSGRSAAMPKWVDLRVYLFTEFDLSSAISFSFGLNAYWREPTLPTPGQRRYQRWQPAVFFVNSRDVQTEEQSFLAFLRALKDMLDWVRAEDDKDIASGRRKHRSTMQFYLWDAVQQEHFMRVVGRHLDAILLDSTLSDLAWLFPSEDVLPNPTASTRKSPITVVNQAVKDHVASPTPHVLSLHRLVQEYRLVKDASFTGPLLEYLQDPLSDLVPSERGHELWAEPNHPDYAARLDRFVKTCKKKLRMLEAVRNRLHDDMHPSLSDHAAPGISVGPPGRIVPAASWDAQLWYGFAKLDAEIQQLEAEQVRSMPPHEREARFKSARLEQRLTGAAEKTALASFNLQPAPSRFVYKLRDGSRDVRMKPGDFTVFISPEGDPALPDQRFQEVVVGTPLEQQYASSTSYGTLMREVLEVAIEAIDRDAGVIVLTQSNKRYPSSIRDLEAHTAIDLRQDAILDSTAPDFFTSKLRCALRAVGNPPIAVDDPLVRRAVGLVGARKTKTTPHTPAADYLWDAPARHADRVTRNWRPAAMKLEGNMAGFSLNSPQWTAVDEALTRRLSVIWGPPGTGKSRTLRHLILVAILEAYEAGRPLRLLVTAGTYTAIDNVLLDLFDDLQGITPIIPSSAYEVKRLRSKSRPTEDAVLNRGLDLPVNKHNLDPALGTLHQRLVHREGITVVGVTPDQVHNFLVATGSAQQELFDLVVLDEASQVDTAHAILPLCAIDGEGSLVVAGDDLQLAPIRKAEPPKGLEKLVGSAYGFFAGHHGVPEAPLEVNYRSNRTLVEFGVKAGYNKTLRPHSPDLRLSLLSPLPTGAVPPVGWPQHLLWSPEWSALLDPDHPAVCFVHDDERSSQSNAFEADAVAALLWLLRERLPVTDSRFGLENDLGPNGIPKPVSTATYGDRDSSGRASGGFWGRGVGVVTPHRAQVGRILSTVGRTFPVTDRELLRGAVDTVERFQGQQRDVIIGSFALGDPDAIVNEDEFLYSLSRFNVMASRARAKLILLVSQTVVDHLSNDLETLRGSRLLKLYADVFCSSERKMTLGYLQLLTIGRPPQLVTRSGLFKWH